jgi:hypothetical protein
MFLEQRKCKLKYQQRGGGPADRRIFSEIKQSGFLPKAATSAIESAGIRAAKGYAAFAE